MGHFRREPYTQRSHLLRDDPATVFLSTHPINMKFKKPNEGGQFEICPEYSGRAVCVDVTPPETVQTDYGPKEKFRLVFECDVERPDGSRACVWSSGFTVSLNEKSAVRKFLRGWLGRDLTEQECAAFTTDEHAFEKFVLNRPAFIVVQHQESGEKTYANIVACTPYKGADPLQPSGEFTRKKDRQPKDAKPGASGNSNGGGSSYRSAEQPQGSADAPVGRDNWMKVKAHVGKHQGVEVGDLDEEALMKLIKNWLPVFKAAPKPTADDKRLAAALELAQAALAGATPQEAEY